MWSNLKHVVTRAFALLAIVVCASTSYATHEKTLTYARGNALGDSILLTRDSGYTNNASLIEQTYHSRNVITVYIDETNEGSTYYLQSAFTAKVYVQYTLKNYAGNSNASPVADTFTITYDTTGIKVARVYRVFPDIYESKVKITAITSNVGWDVKPAIRIENEIDVNRSYKWNSCPIFLGTLSHISTSSQSDTANSFDELQVNWSLLLGADEYDLEWAWMDSATSYSTNADVIFRNNASRISVNSNTYRIPLLYDGRGRLYYRVRPVKVYPDGKRSYGGWSTDGLIGLKYYYFDGFQRKLNWQASTSFAEDGKRKSVVNYFDGTLRSRQTVTKDNSRTDVNMENQTIVAETFYDYQGRAAVQVLPSPSLSTLLTYAKGFNRSSINNAEYDKDNYDKLLPGEAVCGKAASRFDTSLSGASNYYSTSSRFLNIDAAKSYSKYVPDANGYPFTQTEYAADNTGRIARQGGVGEQHQLGKHDTRYYYGKPSQPELDILFGTEAGNFSHYFKNMVRDANGQYSVSYTDMHGRTVATALAGVLPDSIRLMKLSSNINFPITESLIDKAGQSIDGLSIVLTSGITVPVSGNYEFTYQLTPDALKLKNCDSVEICYDCLYDLNIKLVGDCGEIPLDTTFYKVKVDTTVNNSGIDTLCNSQAFSFYKSILLPEGSYMLSKTLTIREESMQYYRDSIFMKQNTCKSFQSFVDEEIDSIQAKLSCFSSCTECHTALGDFNTFKTNYKQEMGITEAQWPNYQDEAKKAYEDAKQACNSLCASDSSMPDNISVREEMLADMTPDFGQYTNDTLQYNIFVTTAMLYTSSSIVYKDEDGKPDTLLNDNGDRVIPNQLSKPEFLAKFKPSWAEGLLMKHPEKRKLDSVMRWEASYKYDELMKNTETFDSAFSKGLFNGPVKSKDPALNGTLTVGNSAFKTTFLDSLKNYRFDPGNSSRKMSVWTLASKMVTCNTDTCIQNYLNNVDTLLNVTGLCQGDKDAVWKAFRSLYLQVKAQRLYSTLNSLAGGGFSYPTPTYTSRFPNPATEGNLSFTPTSQGAASTGAQAQIDSAVAQTCRGYVDLWLQNLSACSYTPTQWTNVKDTLIMICQNGGDIDHVTGSSSVKPSSPFQYRSFKEFIALFNSGQTPVINTNVECNGYLINTPPPYNAPLTQRVDFPVVTKPSDTSCLCINLNGYFTQKQASADSTSTLGSYLRKNLQIEMSDGAADSLRALCNSTDTSCKFLQTAIIVPPAIYTCRTETVPPCIDCSAMDSLYTSFSSEFPGNTPVFDGNDSTQQSINLAFQRYMNYHTGFSLDYTDYLNFMDQCSKPADTTCINLNAVVDSFKVSYYRAPLHLYSSINGCDTARWMSNYGNGTLQVVPMSEVLKGGVFVPKRSGDSFSSLDYADTMCFAPYTFEAKVKLPRNGFAYNPHNSQTNYGFLIQLNYQKNSTHKTGKIAFDIYSDSTNVHFGDDSIGASGPIKTLKNFEDWRVVKAEVFANSIKFYIDGSLIFDRSHQSYDQFTGFFTETFSSSFRTDWVRITDQYGQVLMHEDFNNSCSGLGQMSKDLCKPECRTSFTQYFNQARSTNYTFTQIDSISQKYCGKMLEVCGPPGWSDSCKNYTYLTTVYKQQFSRTDTLYPVYIRTLFGNRTPDDGPKGVFDIDGNLIGNTIDSSNYLEIKKSFVQIWNGNSLNQSIGTLSLDTLTGQLYLKLKFGKTFPCKGILGMRYYQFDHSARKVNGIETGLGAYIDWGDNSKNIIKSGAGDANTVISYVSSASGSDYVWLPPIFHISHKYADSSSRIITVYHPDTLGVVGFRNNNLSGGDTTAFVYMLKRLRGYFPNHTLAWYSYCVQDSSFNTYSKIKNFNKVGGLRVFANGPGWFNFDLLYSTAPYYYAQFITNPVNKFGSLEGKNEIEYLALDTHAGGLVPSGLFRKPIKDIVPDWNTNFPKVHWIYIRGWKGYDYDTTIRYRFKGLKDLQIYVPDISSAHIDSVIKDLAQYDTVCGGTLDVYTYGPWVGPTDINSADIQTLKGRNWRLRFATNTNTWNEVSPAGTCTVYQPWLVPKQDTTSPYTTPFTDWILSQTGSTILPTKAATKITSCGISFNPCSWTVSKPNISLCGRSNSLFGDALLPDDNPCADSSNLAYAKAQMRYEAYLDSLQNTFDSLYLKKCYSAQYLEKFTLRKPLNEYHYTLYFYDQAGNLVKTVPPKAVDLFRDSIFPILKGVVGTMGSALDSLAKQVASERANGQTKLFGYQLATNYRYNSLNQVTIQQTPDAGKSNFWYDVLGRLSISQNAKQQLDTAYSYTLYDYLGRISEVGQKKNSTVMSQTISTDTTGLKNWINTSASTKPRTQITRTFYDLSRNFGAGAPNADWFTQKNLRNRVSYSQVLDTNNSSIAGLYVPSSSGTYRAATYYTYDIHGNVSRLLQHYNSGVMKTAGSGVNEYKLIRYEYDLISGKVNLVSYQPGYYSSGSLVTFPDRFYHQYEYDAENRLTAVYTSQDSVYWEKDARYEYYRHGPLARMEVGHAKMQGLDYAYTLQAWLKGVNSTRVSTSDDMGADGANAPTSGGNNVFARDAAGFALYYFLNDYKHIKTSATAPFAYVGPVAGATTDTSIYAPLYNGNIMGMVTNVAVLTGPIVSGRTNTSLLMLYRYDQLNRIRKTASYPVIKSDNQMEWNRGTNNHFDETFSYDANGNITSTIRQGIRNNGNLEKMDRLAYYYYANTNRLKHVKDTANSSHFSEDIDDQADDNFSYDAIGNLVKDTKESITKITWTVYGKIDSIYKTGSNYIAYTYDATGNRISKVAKIGTPTITTWYVRDAQGNLMSLYTSGDASQNSSSLTQSEIYLFGSSRLGVAKPIINVQSPATPQQVQVTISGSPVYGRVFEFSRGIKSYEISNHLGNVLATVADRKIPVASGGNITYFKPVVLSASDYYAFGMQMPGRTYTTGSGYRYGFNGKENDNEVKGAGNQQDYGMRIYDPRLGKFLSLDPITKDYPELTPYQFASNTPIQAIDLDGLEGFIATGINGHGMVISTENAAQINKTVIVSAFKAVFTQNLPKKFIDHYADGSGTSYKLQKDELTQLHVYYTGLHGGSETDIKKTESFLATIQPGTKAELPEGYSIQGGAGNAGTLGRFTINLKGTVEKKDDGSWTFTGYMKFNDTYDFTTSKTEEGDLTRNKWGDFQTDFASKYLPGKGFEVTSDWIPVKQDNTNYFDWFDDKDQSDISNRLSGTSGEVQKTGTLSGEVKKQDKPK